MRVLRTSILSLCVLAALSASAQVLPRKIGELELTLTSLSAVADPQTVTVPKNTASGVRVAIRSGITDLQAPEISRLLGGNFVVQGDLFGPGLRQPLSLPETVSTDPLLLLIPPMPQAGDYTLSNLRVTVNGTTVLDIAPRTIPITVIDQVLITSVTTRPLTLDELQQRGIILDSKSYLGFEFTLGVALDSKVTQFTFPVVFDSRGVAVPQPIPPSSGLERTPLPPLTTVVPMLLKPSDEDADSVTVRLPGGGEEEVRIPSVLVIPGNVGYLKQFFSAKLFVANGAPGASNLTVHDVIGKIKLPAGADLIAGSADDPLSLPDTKSGPQPTSMPVRATGPDGQAGTADDIGTFKPGEQGEAEFVLRGDKEGFHTIGFDVEAVLDGLVTGPVRVSGSGSGGVLVRNPYFDMSFVAPAVVRQGETFTLYVTVNNISQSVANAVTVTLDSSRMSGMHLVSEPSQTISTLLARDSKELQFQFVSDRNGQVVATYLNFDTQNGTTGNLKFTLGIGERGIPLSPDTLVLPASVQYVPSTVLNAAMRVLGQAWSIANAPSGTLPQGVTRTSKDLVTQKALALAEAGLRVSLGQSTNDAVRDLLFDFYGGSPIDPGFDQILRTTNAGTELARAIGAALHQIADVNGGAAAYERSVAQIAASGSDFVTFAFGSASGAPITFAITDGQNRRTATDATSNTFVNGLIPSAVVVPMSTSADASRIGVIPSPTSFPYTFDLTGTASASIDLAVSFPKSTGVTRASATGVAIVSGGRYRIVIDRGGSPNLQIDANADGVFESQQALSTETLLPQGPRLISANVIGPEALAGASPFGFQVAFLFDRIVDATTSASTTNYIVPKNQFVAAKRQLSGRLVFATLAQPEGPYVASQVAVSGIADTRAVVGPPATLPLGARITDVGAVVSGRVFNADGTPLRDAIITYEQNPTLDCAPPLEDPVGLTEVRTGDDGRYELRYVRQDTCGTPFFLATTDPATGSLREIATSVRVPGEQIVIDIAMFGRGSVTGTVRSLTGATVSGAQVAVLSQVDTQVAGSAMTDTAGKYRVDGITVGAVSVHAVKGASLGRSSGRIDRAGTAATVDLTLDGGTVRASGIVKRVQGTSVTVVPGLQVVYSVRGTGEQTFIPIAVETTDTDGKYAFDGLPTGEYRIDAALNSRDTGYATGIAAAGDVISKDIAIVIGGDGYGTVRGNVKFPDGAPAAGIVVSIDDRGVLSGVDGSFELTGIVVKPTTSQRVTAQSRDGIRGGMTTVLVSQPNQIVSNVLITLSGIGSAEFTALDVNHNPISDLEVDIIGGCANPCGCIGKKTGTDGKVRFDGLPLGTVHARAFRTGFNFLDQADAAASLTSDGSTVFGVLLFSGSGTVSGTVLGPDGLPSLGADVKLVAKVLDEDSCSLVAGVAQRVRTDSAGKFRFTGVNLGDISVTASHPFYATNVGARGTLVKNGDTLDYTLKLVNTISGVFSGNIYLPDGVTLGGAGIEVTANGPLPDVTVTTDANGHFQFAKIFPEGSYTVTARDAITGGVKRESVYLRAGQDFTHDLQLKGRGTVRVKVVNGAGQPVTTAFVTLQETEFPSNKYEAAIDASNGGVATFTNVFNGPLTAQATDPFARGGRASAILPHAGDVIDVQVALTTTGTVKGHFYRPDGTTPIPFGVMKVSINGTTVGETTAAGFDDVAAFAFTYVPAGPIRIEGQDPQTARTGVAIGTLSTEGEIVTLNVIAQGLGRVQGLVTSNGAPQPGAHVDIDNSSYHACTFADSTGHYLIDGVPEGRITATASLNGNFLNGTATGVLAGEATTLNLDVALRAWGKVTGTLLNAGTATAAPLSLVTLQVGGSGGATLSTTTDAAGAFMFDRVPAGLAAVNAYVLGGLDRATTSVDVIGATTTNITVTLNGVASIAGTALDSSGQPIVGDVTITGTGAFAYSFTIQSATNGAFALPQVLAGPFTAVLRAKSGEFFLYGTATGSVAAGQTANITLQVQPSGTVTGVVMRSDTTTPAIGTNVTLQLDPNRGSVVVQAGSDGRFTARGVPLGAFTARLNDPVTTGLALRSSNLVNNGDIVDLGTIVLDDKPLAVISISPVAGTSGVAINQPVTIVFSNQLQSTAGISLLDGNTGVSAVAALSGDGKTVTLTGTWPDSKEITVSISTAVTDIFGRHPISTTSKFTTVDLSPPRVVAIAPVNGAIQVAGNSTIAVTFSEPVAAATDLSSVVTVTGISGTSAVTLPTVVTFTPSASFADNTIYSVTVNGAVDSSGNRQTAPFTSTFATTDTIAPTLTLASPSSTAWTRSLRPSIQINGSDALSGMATTGAFMTIDGQAVAASLSGGSLYFTPASDLTEGMHTLAATMADRAGNVGSLSSTFQLDATAPSAATIGGIPEGQPLRGTVNLSGSATDSTSGVAKIELLVDGNVFATLTAPLFSTSYNTNFIAEGVHTFSARATDAAGNVGVAGASIQATVDNRPLTITITAPAPNTPVRDAVAVSASGSEPLSRIDFTVAGQTSSDATAPYDATFNLTTAAEGPQTITATGFALSGETATATVTVAIDRTPPIAPDAARINAEPPQNSSSLVYAQSGAVEAGATVEITNQQTNVVATTKASTDGSFSVYIAAAVDDVLSIVAMDAVGNRSPATIITVRRTPSLPPSEATTTLHYDGLLVDRVGIGALAPDSSNDAVFTVSLNIGDGVMRTISYIDLSSPSTTRSTRTLSNILGVAADAGSSLLNKTNGSVDFPVTSGATLTLFASNVGSFIQEGATYTVKAVFTDGSQFIGTYYVVPSDDRKLVAHSADVTASPATIIAPGTTTITITNVRDIEGDLVPDGAKIAISAVDSASKDPRGNSIRGAGGTITDGDVAPNNANFKIFTISGGTVHATYSSAPVTPAPSSTVTAIVQIQAADNNGNVLGTEAISTIDVALRPAADRAIVHAVPATLYVDKADRRSHLHIAVRDANGNPAADGTMVVVTANSNAGVANGYYVGSVGGTILGGTASPTGLGYRAFTVASGYVDADYSASGLSAVLGETKSAVIAVNPADANGTRTTNVVMGLGLVTLVGPAKTEMSVSPQVVPYVFPLPPPVQVSVHHVHDIRAHLVPDGANVLVSATSSASIVGCCYLGSYGGIITDGTASPSGAGFKYFPLLQNEIRATYSTQGINALGTGFVQTANVAAVAGDNTGAAADNHALGYVPVTIVGPLNARGSVSQATIFGDGNLYTTTVRFDHILDTYGNPLPEGSKVVTTVTSGAAIVGCCYLGSIGGQILNGTNSPSTNWKTFTITGGGIDITYGNQGISCVPGETKTANVALAAAGANGELIDSHALGFVPVGIVGTTSAQATANPSAFFADGADYRSTITISNVKDALGRAVPDGTLIGVTAVNSATINGCCYLGSAGGSIIGGVVAGNNSNFKIFPVTNGQIVLQYSSQGVVVSSGEKVANIGVVSANNLGNILDTHDIGTVSIRLLAPASATVITDPVNVTVLAPNVTSQITVKDIKSTDGLPLPDGSKVALSVVNSASISGCCYVSSAGGSLSAAGTSPGDGTLSPNNSNFQQYTIAGGEVKAVYNGNTLSAGVGEVRIATVQVVPADRTGAVLNTYDLGTAIVRVNGVTSTTASGTASTTLNGGTATVTYTGIKDAAGNIVPDGTPVAVTVKSVSLISGCCYVGSAGGTITNGSPSPNTNYKWFTTTNGMVTVEYSSQGATGTPARVQIVPAQRDGTPIGGYVLSGGLWTITLN